MSSRLALVSGVYRLLVVTHRRGMELTNSAKRGLVLERNRKRKENLLKYLALENRGVT